MSPRPVRVLEDRVINQIAAGEVVERPASVLKELFENALDAGSTTVEVTLRNGGKDLVRVADNGHGMTREDAMMCLERHATSKIRETDDLLSVATLGVIAAALLSFVLSFFGIDTMLFNLGNAFGGGSAPWIGLGVTGAILILASLWLIVDFRQADELVASNAPKETEWYVAFGLIVTIAWIYFEALKLVYYIAAMSNRD